jgi:hypothetical protein
MRSQNFPPFEGQIRNQYEIWAYNMFNESWSPFENTYNNLEMAKEDLARYVYQGFKVKLVAVEYKIVEEL